MKHYYGGNGNMTHEERLRIFEEVECGCVTDAMIAFGIGSWMTGIFPVSDRAKIYGRARTAFFDIVTPPREIVTPYQLIEACVPGEVMVWNADINANIMGENIYTFAKNHQLGGVVIEGDRIAYVGPAEGLEPYWLERMALQGQLWTSR